MAKKRKFNIDKKPIGLAALLLMGFAVVGIGLVAVTKEVTAERIEKQQLRALLSGLNEIVPSHRYDNNLAEDTTTGQDKLLLGSRGKHIIYRARWQDKPVAVVISTAAKNSYSGTPIELLVGINTDGSVAGVRVVDHRETPGLGDGISLDRSQWILSFNTKSLHSHNEQQWKVKKDGGDFDEFTGATITPRAVVGAVHKTLLYYKKHKDTIFALDAGASRDQ